MSHDKILLQFTNYLQTLNYSHIVCYNSTNQIRNFLTITDKPLSRINKKHIDEFITWLTTVTSNRTKEQLSNVHINGYINSLKRFSKFLFHVHKRNLPIEHIKYLKVDTAEKEVLGVNEVKSLFDICDNTKLGMRDKAMLVLYYSCGLRRNEAIHVELSDIDFDNNILFVRKGKGGKQRYVPFTKQSHQVLRQYINVGRRRLNRKHKFRKTLLISSNGNKIQSQALLNRLKILCKNADIDSTGIGLHTLRHSIATHLMQNEMSIYDISEFLGHSSLESTQIYTHIINE